MRRCHPPHLQPPDFQNCGRLHLKPSNFEETTCIAADGGAAQFDELGSSRRHHLSAFQGTATKRKTSHSHSPVRSTRPTGRSPVAAQRQSTRMFTYVTSARCRRARSLRWAESRDRAVQPAIAPKRNIPNRRTISGAASLMYCSVSLEGDRLAVCVYVPGSLGGQTFWSAARASQ
jgi:hypothetical protein